MVEVEVLPGKSFPTVLTGTVISCINIKAAEANLSLGHPIIPDNKNHPRYPYDTVHQSDGFIMNGYRKITPAMKIEGLILLVYGSGKPLIEKIKGPAHGGDMNRKIGAIQHEHLGVEHCTAMS